MKLLYSSLGLLSLLIVGCVIMDDGGSDFVLTIANQTDYKVEMVNKVEEGEGHRRAILPNDSLTLREDMFDGWPMMYPHDEAGRYLRFEFYSDPVKCYDFTESNRGMGPYEDKSIIIKRESEDIYYRYNITDTLYQLAGSCEDSVLIVNKIRN